MNFNRVASVAAFSVILPFALVACSESNPTSLEEPVADLEPVPESSAELSSGSECQGIVIPEGFLCLQEVCNAENEGRVIAAKHGNPKYGYQVSYAQCKQGSWTNVEPWVACDTVGVAVGDTCSEATSKGGFQFGGNSHAYYIYAGDGVWKEIEPVSVDSSESTTLDIGEDVASPSGESVVSSGISSDSVQVNIDGGVYSFPACNAEREGSVEKIFVGNPKYGSERSFICEQGSWNAKSANDIECNQTDAKVGDICSIDYAGYVPLGGPIRLSCYVYTENGWTYKGYDDWYDPAYAGTCEELLNAPKIETECTDGESAERTVDDKVYHYICSSGEWQIHNIERPVFADPAEMPTDSDATAE